MVPYSKLAFRFFGKQVRPLVGIFPDVKTDLKKARLKYSAQEYFSLAIFTTFLIFLIALPILAFLFGFLSASFLFSFVSAFTVGICIALITFMFFLNYPKFVIKQRAKEIDRTLPFASLYLSTVASSKLPLHKTFELFSKFSGYGEIAEEMNTITSDTKLFGLDIHTALERGVDRSPSKSLSELLWGILSTLRAGADLSAYLKQKSLSFMQEYRKKLYEFSHSLTIYIELYLTSIVLGAIFFTILTAIISGIGGATQNIILLQFLLIFIFVPLISIIFILLIKHIAPAGE
jgi:archaellum biogenesis protein FlaJ (TadC family)